MAGSASTGGTVLTNAGLSITGTRRLQQIPAVIDTLIVAGGDEAPLRVAIVEQGVSAWLSEIARTLALPMLRGGEQPQLSQALQAQKAASHRLRELIAWIGTHLQENLSVEALAERAQMSPRHFARAFAAETGSTPARFVEQTRVAAAAQLLRRTRWAQDRIASGSGFRSVDALQRAFARQYGLTPRAYREGE